MSRMRRAPSVTDVVVALGTGAVTLLALAAAPELFADHATPSLGSASWWVFAAVLTVQAAALCFARSAPVAVLLGTSAGALLIGITTPTGLGSLADAAVLVAVLRATPVVTVPTLRVVLPVAGLLVAGGQAADILGSSAVTVPAAVGAALLQAVAIVALPAAGVLAVTARRDARRAEQGESEAVRRERAAVVDAAVARERTAMARELHDIAAHHVSSIALMSGVIERQIATDPDAARVAVRQVREQSRVLLDDLRQLVGLLRRDGDGRDTVETIETVAALVDAARATGRAVEFSMDRGAAQVGPLGQLVVYRMVQEALANAARHAPGAPCEVRLDGTRPGVFVATVRDAGVPPALAAPSASAAREGFGLLGMRERAGLVGGTLDAGPEAGGGWRVRLTVPAEALGAPGASS